MASRTTSSLLRSSLRAARSSHTLAGPSSLHRPVVASVAHAHKHASLILGPSRLASSVSPASPGDPVPTEVEKLMLQGLECMADSDLEGAHKAFKRSIEMKETPAALYNYALVLYQQGQVPDAINAFERSLVLEPSADAHVNVASAYILSTPPDGVKAIAHLQKAVELSPNDGEINFNMGVIFEASNRLEDALREYKRAQELGIERAAQCIRNVGGKLVAQEREAVEASQSR